MYIYKNVVDILAHSESDCFMRNFVDSACLNFARQFGAAGACCISAVLNSEQTESQVYMTQSGLP